MNDITLQSLIKKHKRRIKTLRETQVGYDYPDMQAYYDWVELAKMYLRYRFPSNESVVEFCKLSDEPISREKQQRLLAILNAFHVLQTIIHNKNNIKMEKEGINLNVTVNNNNTQSQNQSIIITCDKEFPKPRSGILAKLKASCYTIITGVLVDVLGDLDFWQWLHYHLELILGCILL
jgi:hypothetical protein